MGASEVVPTAVDLTRRVSAPAMGAALGRAAVALNSSLERDAVFDVLAREILTNTDAERASVLLTSSRPPGRTTAEAATASEDIRATEATSDTTANRESVEGTHGQAMSSGMEAPLGPRWLEPVVSLARTPDAALSEAFRSLGPIELDAHQRRAFGRARPVPVLDAARSELIPAGWAQQFDLQSVLLVPLFTSGEPCGLLAVDWPRRQAFDDSELELLETMGELAGVAVGNARQLQQARRRARLGEATAQAAAELAPPLAEETAHWLATAVGRLLDSDLVMVGRLDADGHLRPLIATDGVSEPPQLTLSEVADRIVEQVRAIWAKGVTRACQLAADPWLLSAVPDGCRDKVGGFVLLPLLAQGRPVAAVFAAINTAAPLEDDLRQLLETLGVTAGAALERGELQTISAQQRTSLNVHERLLELSAAPLAHGRLVETVRELLAGEGVEVVALTYRDHDLRRGGGTQPTALDRHLWHRAEQTTGPASTAAGRTTRTVRIKPTAGGRLVSEPTDDGRLAIALAAGGTAVGTLYVSPEDLSMPQARLLATVAMSTARLIQRPARWGETDRSDARWRQALALANQLTHREGDVLHLLVGHLFYEQIAERLVVSCDTVKTHVKNIREKLNVHDRHAAARKAVDLDLLPGPDIDPTEAGR